MPHASNIVFRLSQFVSTTDGWSFANVIVAYLLSATVGLTPEPPFLLIFVDLLVCGGFTDDLTVSTFTEELNVSNGMILFFVTFTALAIRLLLRGAMNEQ
jgi:hypothetical protein